ncbi:MAG: TonB-dependent receptor, partial [Aquificae bacterium]|nr:TonB-dependent receptor [Aquificota bacterium]
RQDFIHKKSGGIDLNKRYHNYGYFITNILKLLDNKLILSQSIRHDSYSSFKDKTTWKLGGKFLIKDAYISANWGTAYNVPTPDQLYNTYWGNPNLAPENVLQWDISLGYKNFSITYFKSHIKNLIDYNFSTSKYSNFTGKSKIEGIEAKYSYYLNKLNTYLYLSYTYLDTKSPDGKELPRRPEHQIGFDLIWYPDENVNIGFSGVYVGNRKDIDGTQTGYYTVINAFSNMKISEKISTFLKINNITDKYYQTVNGYATEGRSVYAGVDILF